MKRAAALLGAALAASAGCEVRPIVTIENQIARPALVRNVRWNGCVWPELLDQGKSTMPKPCLSGRARVYFECADDPIAGPWLGYQTSFEADGDAGDTLKLVISPETQEPDRSAPNAFGH